MKKDHTSSDDVSRLITLDSVPESAYTQSDDFLELGSGNVAKTAIETADQKGVHIREYPALTNLMLRLDADEAIPEDIRAVMDSMLGWMMEICRTGKCKI